MAEQFKHGQRFAPLAVHQLSVAQRTLVNRMLAGRRGRVGAPWNALLRSPDLADPVEQLGRYVRFEALPPRLYELAVLVATRHFGGPGAQYPWSYHCLAAPEAGINEEIVEAIGAGREPTDLAPDEAAVYAFCREMLRERDVSDATFFEVVRLVGEKGVIDLIGTLGYYNILFMIFAVDRFPPTDGSRSLPPM